MSLVDRRAACSNVVSGLCRAHGLGLPAEQWLLGQLADRANTSDFAQFRAAFDLSESPDTLWQEYVDRMAAAIISRSGVLEGLAELRAANWTIGIVTNGSTDTQRAKLAATGISDWSTPSRSRASWKSVNPTGGSSNSQPRATASPSPAEAG